MIWNQNDKYLLSMLWWEKILWILLLNLRLVEILAAGVSLFLFYKFREIEFHEFFLVLLSVFSQLLILARLVRLEFVFQNRNKCLGFHLILNDCQYFFPGHRPAVLICPVKVV